MEAGFEVNQIEMSAKRGRIETVNVAWGMREGGALLDGIPSKGISNSD